jgi:hypothetical protein
MHHAIQCRELDWSPGIRRRRRCRAAGSHSIAEVRYSAAPHPGIQSQQHWRQINWGAHWSLEAGRILTSDVDRLVFVLDQDDWLSAAW